MRKILLTGANGQVGWELKRTLAPLGQIIAPESSRLNLADPAAVRQAVRELRPDLIVNPAAYTAVDKAESEPELAYAVNASAPAILADEAKRCGAVLVHFSTDYVFDGTKHGAYTESDPTNPLGVYGASKLQGEQAIQAADLPHLIFRTSWVYGARGKNFLLTILRLARERDNLNVVGDQIGAPTWSRMIAECTALAIARYHSPEDSGIYHLTASGSTSWHGFAKAILEERCSMGDRDARSTLRLLPDSVNEISTAEYPTLAHRPSNSVLSGAKLLGTFGIAIPHWRDCLRMMQQDLQADA